MQQALFGASLVRSRAMNPRRLLIATVGISAVVAVAWLLSSRDSNLVSRAGDAGKRTSARVAPLRVGSEPSACGTITGFAYGVDGHGLAHVPVAVRGSRMRRIVFSDSDGHYSVSELNPAKYTVSTSSSDATASLACDVAASQTTRIDIRLSSVGPAVTLSGTIRDVFGGPVPGAEVWIEDENPTRMFVVLAGDDGRFTARVPRAEHALVVRAPGYAKAFSLLTVTTDVAVDLVLHPAATIRGTVVDREGVAVADARVHVDSFGTEEVTSRPDGSFSIGELSAGSYTVVALHPSGWGRARGVDVGPLVNRDVRVEIEPTRSVAGRVLTQAGTPISGATVRSVGTETSSAPTSTSGPDGYFLLHEVPQGPTSVEACADDFVCARSAERVIGAVGLTGMDVTLARGATIRLSVVDAARNHIAGAYAVAGEANCVTGDDGTCELSNLRPQTTKLSAHHPLLGTGEIEIPVRPGRQQASLRLDPGATLRGTATWEDGAAAASVHVVVGNLVARSDRSGHYELTNVGPGAVTIYASETLAPDRFAVGDAPIGSKPLSLDVRPGEHRARVDVVVARRAARISGRVVTHATVPVPYPRLAVSLSSSRDGDGPPAIAESAVWYGAADGAFTLERLPEGVFDVWAEAENEPRGVARNVKAGTAGIEITLPQGSAVRGDVVTSSGSPVTDALIVLNASPFFREQRTRDGLFEFSGLGAMKRVEVSARTPTGLIGAIESIEVHEAEQKAIQIVIHEPVGIRGRLVEWPDSKPVSGVKLLASCGTRRWSTVTDEDGSFRVDGLVPGLLELWAFDPDHGLHHERWLHRLSGQSPTTDIGTISFMRRDGIPDEASASYVRDGEQVIVAHTLAKSARLPGLAKGDVILSVSGHPVDSFSIPSLGAVLDRLATGDEVAAQSPGGAVRVVAKSAPSSVR